MNASPPFMLSPGVEALRAKGADGANRLHGEVERLQKAVDEVLREENVAKMETFVTRVGL